MASKQYQAAAEPVAMNVLLSSSTSLIYSWHVNVADLLNTRSAPSSRNNRQNNNNSAIPPFHLVGVIELPLKVIIGEI
jgi:hypothetical protein